MTQPLNVAKLVDIQHHANIVNQTMMRLVEQRKAGNDIPLLQFFNDYTSWNGYFANGVCLLTAHIGLQRGLFRTQHLSPIFSTADRSNLVASYIFDAARDEFDDSATTARDPHRSLAQAFLIGLVDNCRVEPDELNPFLLETREQHEANAAVLDGYQGRYVGAVSPASIFFGIGYHIGSEVLADQEFTTIDRIFKSEMPDLYERLTKEKIKMDGVELSCYDWIKIHSGDGHAVEQDHFNLALEAARQALKFTPHQDHDRYLAYLTTGFLQFAYDHEFFFSLDWAGSL